MSVRLHVGASQALGRTACDSNFLGHSGRSQSHCCVKVDGKEMNLLGPFYCRRAVNRQTETGVSMEGHLYPY